MHANRSVRARAGVALATLALGALLAGCGSDEPKAADEPTPTTSTSPGATDTETATDEASPDDDGGQAAVAEFVKRLQAGIDNTEQAHITFTMSGTGGEMKGSGDVDYTSDPPEMQMSMAIGPQTVEMVLVGGQMYVKSSQAGDKYIAFDLSDPNNPLGAGFADQLDPASSMKNFAEAISSVTMAGSEKIDGQAVDRYELVVDTTKLATESSTGQLPPKMDVTVWLDDQDRMARSLMDMGAIQYDARLSRFDKAVDLAAPPAGQVATPPGS